MNAKDLIRLGVPMGAPQRRVVHFISRFILGRFDPKLVKMAPAGVVSED